MAHDPKNVGFGAAAGNEVKPAKAVKPAKKSKRSAPKSRRRKKETEKKRKNYERNIASGMTKKDAALNAGFSPSMARNAAVKIETPEVVARLSVAAAIAIPDHVVIDKLREGSDAYLVKTATFEGAITDHKAFPDFVTRLDYLRLRMELTGDLPTSKAWQPPPESTPQSITNIMVIDERIAGLFTRAAVRSATPKLPDGQ